ncbi:MAG: VWA domain-containing protein [Acidobacteriota bacterium]|nr:VWA domain-containing protein [Blastocatellia bacterium]MDW8412013.1 VWA domain-containing protein [Acidobacteriota bacterium]
MFGLILLLLLQSEAILKVRTEQVLLHVTVADERKRPVKDLRAEDFELYEDGKRQSIEYFSDKPEPLSLGLVIDTSGSMRYRLKLAVRAAMLLLENCSAEDEVFVVEIKDRPQLLSGFTSAADAKRFLEDVVAVGGTALLDALLFAATYAQENSANSRKVLVVFSDGDDRQSTTELQQLAERLRYFDIQLYLVCLPEGYVFADGMLLATATRSHKLMKRMAEESGGQVYFPMSVSALEGYVLDILQTLRGQYTLGYEPTTLETGWHRISVKVRNRRLNVHTRAGYFRKGA